jgi:hypothetical protein
VRKLLNLTQADFQAIPPCFIISYSLLACPTNTKELSGTSKVLYPGVFYCYPKNPTFEVISQLINADNMRAVSNL